jgi:hypothetical protein
LIHQVIFCQTTIDFGTIYVGTIDADAEDDALNAATIRKKRTNVHVKIFKLNQARYPIILFKSRGLPLLMKPLSSTRPVKLAIS